MKMTLFIKWITYYSKILFVFYLIFSTNILGNAQGVCFKGIISNKKNNVPLELCSVFISGTTIGTTTNNEGFFYIKNAPTGDLELIVSCMGFKKYKETFRVLEDSIITIYVKLTEDTLILPEFQVVPNENEWQRNYLYFIKRFMGNSEFAQHCIIKNPKVLNFNLSPDKQKFSAWAYEPLIIENKDLGYKIEYYLDKFEEDLNKNILLNYYYPFFTSVKESKKVKNNRMRAYYGSSMHFRRCLYDSTFYKENFSIKKIKKFVNLQQIDSCLIKIYSEYRETQNLNINDLEFWATKRYEIINNDLNFIDIDIDQPIDYMNDIVTVNKYIKKFIVEGIYEITYPYPQKRISYLYNLGYFTPQKMLLNNTGTIFNSNIFIFCGDFSKERIPTELPSDYIPN